MMDSCHTEEKMQALATAKKAKALKKLQDQAVKLGINTEGKSEKELKRAVIAKQKELAAQKRAEKKKKK